MNPVPDNWEMSSLGAIANDISYGFTTTSKIGGNGAKLLRITDIQDGNVNWATVPHCTDLPRATYLLRPGDIVIARTGATTGKSYLIEDLSGDVVYASYLIRLRVYDLVEPKYLWSFLQSNDYWSQIQMVSKGTAQPGANATILSQVRVPIAPRHEQRRIMAKIDSLSAKSGRARGHLDHLPRLVEKYKQAVLAAAFRGDLTREWRKKSMRSVTPEDLNTVRLDSWTRAKKQGRVHGRYSEALPIDWKPEFSIPNGWAWSSIDQISHLVQYGTSAKTDDSAGGVVVLRMGNIQSGELDLSSLKFLPTDHEEFPDLLLSSGDVLFNRTNSAELVGKSAVYRGTPDKASFASYLIRVACCGMLPELVSGFINSLFGREWVASVVNQQVGQANVNGTKLRQLGLPVMPVEEQHEISQRVRGAFTWIDRLASDASNARTLVDHLDQAVLAKAFRGELVPQNPADEPASVLLERIRAERATSQGGASTRGRPRRTA
jgi:type I restriction enzyme S subunit